MPNETGFFEEARTGRGKPEITRFKGLGEMMPKVLWETTLNRSRGGCYGSTSDQIATDRVINELMGKDARAPASSWNGRKGGGAGRLSRPDRTLDFGLLCGTPITNYN